jgi:hypothetical protein
MSFAEVAANNDRVVLWTPCNEGSGLVLKNLAGDGAKEHDGLAVTAWQNYDAATRPAVEISQGALDKDSINHTPYTSLGNRRFPGDWPGQFSAALMRFSGALTFCLWEPGEDPSAHSFGVASNTFGFASADDNFYSEPYSTDDQLIGIACHTQVGKRTGDGAGGTGTGVVENIWTVIKFDPANGEELSNTTKREVVPASGFQSPYYYTQDGGWPMSNMDILGVGGVWELYAGMHVRLKKDEYVKGARTAGMLHARAKAMFQQWRRGEKDIPREFYSVVKQNAPSNQFNPYAFNPLKESEESAMRRMGLIGKL